MSNEQKDTIYKLYRVANKIEQMNIYAHKDYAKFDDSFPHILHDLIDHIDEVLQNVLAFYEGSTNPVCANVVQTELEHPPLHHPIKKGIIINNFLYF